MTHDRLLGASVALTMLLYALAGRAGEGSVFVVDDGERLRKFEVDPPLARGVDNPIWRPGQPIRLAALRDEVVAFQVVVQAGPAALDRVTVEIEGLGSSCPLRVERFVEHFAHITTRSFNETRPSESLGWAPAARPLDKDQLGWVPDALLPVEALARADPGLHWTPYPLTVSPRSLGAVWVDITVPRSAAPGTCTASVLVRAEDRELERIPLRIDVGAAVLPYRAVSFLAYYARGELTNRIGSSPHLENSFWQLMHAHHVDALGNLESPGDVERLRATLDGTLYTEARGYRGPGVGVPPAAVALGTYGGFGEPSGSAVNVALATVAQIPSGVEDVFLYASDEDCDSTVGPAWRRVARRTPGLQRLRVAQTCDREPRQQDVDLALLPAQAFSTQAAWAARALEKSVWIYNGALPRTGSLLVDAGANSLLVDGWIAATHDVGRWFLWESTFWNDDNRGGRGPVDPFATFESFHNQHGDTALADGLLVYPGAQDSTFPEHSLGLAQVLPSIRLKSLRRGIQDAGYFALARSRAPILADAVVDELIPRALDEASTRDAPSWPAKGRAFADARAVLRSLIGLKQDLAPKEVRAALSEASVARWRRVSPTWRWPSRRTLGWLVLTPVLGLVAARAYRRRRATQR